MALVSDSSSRWAASARTPGRRVESPRVESAAPLLPIPSSLRFPFLNGLRALASLYVVLHHCCQIYQDPSASPRYGYYPIIPWLLRGRAVAVFMVLSGLLLMLPVVRSANRGLPHGFRDYLKRRARRIIPPYYVALALSLLCIALIPGFNRDQGEFWSRALPPFSAGSIVSHLLLLHGLSANWVYRINPPLWTLSTEWMLYFMFPIVLLPIWRKMGTLSLVIIATTIGFLPRLLLHNTDWHFNWLAPWSLGLFAMGMAGAVLLHPSKDSSSATRFGEWFAGPLGAIALACGFAALWKSRLAMDYLFGASTLWIILHCADSAAGRSTISRRGLLHVLQWRGLQAIGNFSYSIYLIHGPVLMIVYHAMNRLTLTAGQRALIMFVAAPLIAIGAGRLFYQWVERPLLPSNKMKTADLPEIQPLATLAPARRVRPLQSREPNGAPSAVAAPKESKALRD